MNRVPEIVPVTDLRQDAAAVLERLKGSLEPMVITQRGRAAAILLSPESYERAQQERAMLQMLARGERDLTENEGHTLDAVLRDADELLEGDA